MDTNFESYTKGLNDAWELAAKTEHLMSIEEVVEIYGLEHVSLPRRYAMLNITGMQAMAAYEKYKQKKAEEEAIVVGDVVKYEELKGVILEIEEYDGEILYSVFTEDGKIKCWPAQNCTRCDKRISVADWIIEGIKSAKEL